MTTEKKVTAPFRASFPHVFKPASIPGTDSEPKYSVSMLFPKSDPDSKKFIALAKKLVEEEKIAKWGKNAPKKLRSCIIDGDDEDEVEASGGQTTDHWIIKATSNSRPDVIDRNGDPCTPETFYPGVWARASVVFRAYDKGSNGVACHFQNFLKWKDDEPFGGGRAKASDEFSEFLDGSDTDRDDDESDLDI